jgi:hypothetical protein
MRMFKSLAMVLIAVSTTLACSSSNPTHHATTNTQDASANTPDPNNADPSNPDSADAGDNTNTNNPPPDNSTDAGSAVVDAGTPAPTNQAECLADCEAQYPAAQAESNQLDSTCYKGSCASACDNIGSGTNKTPSADAGAKCDTNAANSYEIGTPSQACSDCLASTPACCTLWIKIFGSADGQSLNQCANNCWSKFPN